MSLRWSRYLFLSKLTQKKMSFDPRHQSQERNIPCWILMKIEYVIVVPLTP